MENVHYRGRSVLVTGGTGFIGRHLVKALLEQGAQVRVLVRGRASVPPDWTAVKLFQGDLADITSLERACQGVEIVFHAAGFAHAMKPSPQSADLHWQINGLGTQRLLQAVTTAGVTHFVFLSSVKAMGEGGQRCVDENWPALPKTPYGRAKRAAEGWVLETGRRHSIHVVNLRLAMVYGPGGQGNLARMIVAVRKGLFPPLPEVGNKRSMVHVWDTVRAALEAAQHPAANQNTYIITDGHAYSSRQIYDWICRGLNKPIPAWTVPVSSLRVLGWIGDLLERILGRNVGFNSEIIDKLLGWACYSSDKIQRELAYRPLRTLPESLPEMIRESIRTSQLQ